MGRKMIPDKNLGWFVVYEPESKIALVDEVEEADDIEIIERFDFVDSLFVDGDEDAVESLEGEEFVKNIEQEKVAETL